MNSWQMAQQIKAELQAITWPGGGQEVVFGQNGVIVHAGTLSEDEHPRAFPFALVSIGAGAPDPDAPDLIEQQFDIVTAVRVRGDHMGEHAVIGGARPDIGSSSGAGSSEVAERVRAALQGLTRYDGAAMIVSGTGVAQTQVMQDKAHVAYEGYTVTAQCTSQPFHTAPQVLKRVANTFTWDATAAQQRFDFLHFVLGYVVGDTPADSPLDAGWTTIATTTYGMANATVAGGRTYQVFAAYDPRGTAAAAYYSAAERGSYVAT